MHNLNLTGLYYRELAEDVVLRTHSIRGIVVVKSHPNLTLIGTGKTAAVFRINGTEKVIKIVPLGFKHLAKEEGEIYKKLQGISSFPSFYESGDTYLVMEYIKGYTLYECLNRGIIIRETYIQEVDDVLRVARKRGLNPSDVHLKNIILTEEGQIKIIDVARFRQKTECKRWTLLKKGYKKIYKKRYFPTRLPKLLMEVVSMVYKKIEWKEHPILVK